MVSPAVQKRQVFFPVKPGASGVASESWICYHSFQILKLLSACVPHPPFAITLCRLSTVVVQRFCKPKVGSSNLSAGTIKIKGL
jgi:hypothetical protein